MLSNDAQPVHYDGVEKRCAGNLARRRVAITSEMLQQPGPMHAGRKDWLLHRRTSLVAASVELGAGRYITIKMPITLTTMCALRA